MSRRSRRRRGVGRGGKVALGLTGVALLGAAGVAIYLLLKRDDSLSPPPLVASPWAPNIEVTPVLPVASTGYVGMKCRSSSVCGPGLVCINGECRPESEWYS